MVDMAILAFACENRRLRRCMQQDRGCWCSSSHCLQDTSLRAIARWQPFHERRREPESTSIGYSSRWPYGSRCTLSDVYAAQFSCGQPGIPSCSHVAPAVSSAKPSAPAAVVCMPQACAASPNQTEACNTTRSPNERTLRWQVAFSTASRACCTLDMLWRRGKTSE
jgi:hypothetical protein